MDNEESLGERIVREALELDIDAVGLAALRADNAALRQTVAKRDDLLNKTRIVIDPLISEWQSAGRPSLFRPSLKGEYMTILEAVARLLKEP